MHDFLRSGYPRLKNMSTHLDENGMAKEKSFGFLRGEKGKEPMAR